MRILVTNDDGILAPGLTVLTDFARKIGQVTVIAPEEQQSGKSLAIELTKPYEVRRLSSGGTEERYALTSTTADCVRYGLYGLHRSFDLILSGVNGGFNLGIDSSYSGTVGAVFEASFARIPAISFSTGRTGFSHIPPLLDGLWAFLEKEKILEKSPWLNVNFPTPGVDVAGVALTRLGGAYQKDTLVEDGAGTIRLTGRIVYRKGDDLTVDLDALHHGYITVTPLTHDRTDRAALQRLSKDGPALFRFDAVNPET